MISGYEDKMVRRPENNKVIKRSGAPVNKAQPPSDRPSERFPIGKHNDKKRHD